MSNKNYSEAIALFRKALTIEHDNVIGLTNLGGALSGTGKHRQALTVLRKAEGLESDDRNLNFNIVVAMMNIGAVGPAVPAALGAEEEHESRPAQPALRLSDKPDGSDLIARKECYEV